MYKYIFPILSICILSSCKTFITRDANTPIAWDFNPDLMTEKMCITNTSKGHDSPPCFDPEETINITKIDDSTFVFPITKSFLKNGFLAESELKSEIEKDFVAEKNKPYGSAELWMLAEAINLFADDFVDRSREKAYAERIAKAEQDKRKYISQSIYTVIGRAKTRLENNPNNSGIGIAVRPVNYTIQEDGKQLRRGLAEVFLVDMQAKNTRVSEIAYGYLDYFNSGFGGFNIYIPTCYVKTSRRIDGCSFQKKEDIVKWVRESQKQWSGYGKAVFKMSLAKYIPPPEIPRAKGVLSQL